MKNEFFSGSGRLASPPETKGSRSTEGRHLELLTAVFNGQDFLEGRLHESESFPSAATCSSRTEREGWWMVDWDGCHFLFGWLLSPAFVFCIRATDRTEAIPTSGSRSDHFYLSRFLCSAEATIPDIAGDGVSDGDARSRWIDNDNATPGCHQRRCATQFSETGDDIGKCVCRNINICPFTCCRAPRPAGWRPAFLQAVCDALHAASGLHN